MKPFCLLLLLADGTANLRLVETLSCADGCLCACKDEPLPLLHLVHLPDLNGSLFPYLLVDVLQGFRELAGSFFFSQLLLAVVIHLYEVARVVLSHHH